ncbi:hypothetical protein B0J14DRAFT_699823 [Halenospora varia]|nr:hypothetical protein B0J14DRAFT_699823 [Halenospora varia]
MFSFSRFLLLIQYALLLLSRTVDGKAVFVNPPGPNGALTLSLGESFLIEWQDAGSDYSMLSLGLLAAADGNIFWLISNDLKYTTSSYQFTVGLGNGITLSQGNVFAFILVNGTSFGEQVISPTFKITQSSSSSSSSTSTTLKTSSTSSTSSTLATTTSNSASVTGASATLASATITLSSSSSPTSTSSSDMSSGLSTGVKAAIGVVVPIAAIAVLGALFYFLRRRRHSKAQQTPQAELAANKNKYVYSGIPHTEGMQQIHEAPANNAKHQAVIHEAP